MGSDQENKKQVIKSRDTLPLRCFHPFNSLKFHQYIRTLLYQQLRMFASNLRYIIKLKHKHQARKQAITVFKYHLTTADGLGLVSVLCSAVTTTFAAMAISNSPTLFHILTASGGKYL